MSRTSKPNPTRSTLIQQGPSILLPAIRIRRTTGVDVDAVDPANQGRHRATIHGNIHLAFDVDSGQEVDRLTERLERDGYRVVDGPRRTGDGCYESVVFDPDGNRIEITA